MFEPSKLYLQWTELRLRDVIKQLGNVLLNVRGWSQGWLQRHVTNEYFFLSCKIKESGMLSIPLANFELWERPSASCYSWLFEELVSLSVEGRFLLHRQQLRTVIWLRKGGQETSLRGLGDMQESMILLIEGRFHLPHPNLREVLYKLLILPKYSELITCHTCPLTRYWHLTKFTHTHTHKHANINIKLYKSMNIQQTISLFIIAS